MRERLLQITPHIIHKIVTVLSFAYPLPRHLIFKSECHLLKKWAADRKNLVEIGVFEGASGVLLRSAMAAEATLHLIDPFVAASENPYLRARKWMAKLNLARVRNGSIRWYEDCSCNVVNHWHEPIDFLFIDGDHSETACKKDWDDWSPFVESGGIVIFHDARHGLSGSKYWDGWPGPTKVVNKLFRGRDALRSWQIIDEVGSSVVVQRFD